MLIRYRPLSLLVSALVLLSSHSAAQWIRVRDVDSTESYAVIASGNTLHAAVGNTVYRSTNRGTSWSPLPQVGPPPLVILSLAETPTSLIAGTIEDGVFEFKGSQWISRSNGLVGLGSHTVNSLAVRDSFIYAGTVGAGIFRTHQSFTEPWIPFRDGFPSNTSWNTESLTNLNGTLLAGAGANAYYYRNRPGASQWEEIQFAQFSPFGTSFLAAVDNNNTIHAVGSQGFHRSTDGGTTWTTMDPGIGGISTGRFAKTPGGTYALASKLTSAFLFRLSKDDSSWTQVDVAKGQTFALASSGNALFASKFDGLWKYDLSVTSVKESLTEDRPAVFTLEQNYPNPFNPSTVVHYRLASASRVLLSVFDMLGRRVATLVSEEKPAGSYSVKWDASNMAGGVYFCTLEAGAVRATRRMLLIR
jgi:hypothetical protein